MHPFAALFVFPLGVNVEEEKGTILPTLYECLICMCFYLNILKVIHVTLTKTVTFS